MLFLFFNIFHPQSFGAKQKNIALLDKVLDLLQPANVLLLLLHVDVLRNEDGEIGVNASLVEVVLKESLQVLIELREGRAGVHLLGGEGLVGDLSLGEVGGGQVGDGLDLEGAAVGHKVDAECAGVLLAGARDQDVDVGGESRVGVVLEENISIAVAGPQSPYSLTSSSLRPSRSAGAMLSSGATLKLPSLRLLPWLMAPLV
jgi:hypothetical protein